MYIHIYARNILLILLVVYSYLSMTSSEGSIFSRGSIILILVISTFYFINTFFATGKKTFLYNAWSFLLIINIVGFILTANYFDTQHYGMFLSILATLTPFYPIYYFSKYGLIKSKHLVWFMIAMIPIAILGFYSNQAEIISSGPRTVDNVINNMAYVFVRLMPFVFLIRKRKSLSVLLMAIMMIFIILSAKRGALISGVLILIMFFYDLLSTMQKKNKTTGYIIVLTSISMLCFLAYHFFMQNEYLIIRLMNLAEGNSSGRDRIWSAIFNSWYGDGNFLTFILGHGFAASLVITDGYYAHNDWLELISNFGLVGAVTYLALILSAIRLSFNKNLPFEQRILMKTVVGIWLFISLVSMWYTNMYGYLQSILLAFVVGNHSNLTSGSENILSENSLNSKITSN